MFFNEAAGELLGLRFEEASEMAPEEWGTRFEPVGVDVQPIPVAELPLSIAMSGRPAHTHMRIRSAGGWISGYGLAHDAELLLHDCQYTDAEYPTYLGWGHSCLGDTLQFARRCEAPRTLLFHHDPMHTDDDLDAMLDTAIERWASLGGEPESIGIAIERHETRLAGATVSP